MTEPTKPSQTRFDPTFGLMGVSQQLAARSLLNLIEMISSNSHQFAQENRAFAQEAMMLMHKASTSRTPADLAALQKDWAETCLKFGRNQTLTTMSFIEQCGLQALDLAARSSSSAAEPSAPAETTTQVTPRKSASKKSPATPRVKP